MEEHTMTRKLATIRKIIAINPIEGADAIVAAIVDGWQVVVKKDEFSIGDLAVYFEIDSWIPHELAPYLSKGHEPRTYNGVKGEKLRTVRLRGQVSQGLLLPISILGSPEEIFVINDNSIGTDVSDQLGIQKYEAPIPGELSGQVTGTFPKFIPKTDQERCQNQIEDIFITNKDSRYEVTMKLDGTSFTDFHDIGKAGVCSRNWELKIDNENKDNTLVRMHTNSGLGAALAEIELNYAIQGELMGPGIQANRENLKAHTLYIFDIYDIDRSEYFAPLARHNILDHLHSFGVSRDMVMHVPIMHLNVTLAELGITNIKELLAFAEGPSIVHPIREGLVFKRMDGKFSFKVISTKFLLKEKD